MIHPLMGMVEGVGDAPVLQGVLVALATFIMEDPVTVGSGLLVADGKMHYLSALLGLTIGIAIGDFGLYLVGRFFGDRCVSWGLVSQDRFDRGREWMGRNLLSAVVASRFVPGTRIPTFVGAGILRAHPLRFLCVALFASLMWSLTLLFITIEMGRRVLPLLGGLKWPLALLAVAAFALWQVRKGERKKAERAALPPAPTPTVSFFEFWPPWLFYIPVALNYVWLALRYRSLTLPSVVNPSIYSGGISRESKSQILSLVGASQRHRLAQWVVAQRTAPGREGVRAAVRRALAAMRAAGLAFPIVAKPDEGQRGAGVRIVRSARELASYLARMPRQVPTVLQELIEGPEEVGVFYYRRPGDARGQIGSITRKSFPTVVGDGKATIGELIDADPRARLLPQIYKTRFAGRLDEVPADGERVPLVFAGNHCQGAVFTDGRALRTPALRRAIDAVAQSMPEFWFGRMDIRFRSEAELMRGEGFRIVEINGATAEATHIWDAGMTLRGAYRTLFAQFRTLFEISDLNRRRGYRPLSARQLWADMRLYWRRARHYPPSM